MGDSYSPDPAVSRAGPKKGSNVSVTVNVVPDGVDITFAGADRLWTLSRGIILPRARIRSVRVADRRATAKECPALRLPGGYLPGVLHTGSYGTGDKRQLWCVHRASEVLVLELTGSPYCRVVLEVDDPAAVRKRIIARAR